jgi:hypothetical protein
VYSGCKRLSLPTIKLTRSRSNRRKSHERGNCEWRRQSTPIQSSKEPLGSVPAVDKEQASDYCDKLISNLERYRNAQSRTKTMIRKLGLGSTRAWLSSVSALGPTTETGLRSPDPRWQRVTPSPSALATLRSMRFTGPSLFADIHRAARGGAAVR